MVTWIFRLKVPEANLIYIHGISNDSCEVNKTTGLHYSWMLNNTSKKTLRHAWIAENR